MAQRTYTYVVTEWQQIIISSRSELIISLHVKYLDTQVAVYSCQNEYVILLVTWDQMYGKDTIEVNGV